jgi:AraC-like DNA-binding protein
MKDLLQKLINSSVKYASAEGQNPTPIPFMEVLKSSTPTALRHGMLQPSFCIILQGQKKVLFGSEVLKYGPGGYLAAITDLPASGQITTATTKNPYLGLRIEFSAEEIAEVLLESGIKINPVKKVKAGAFLAYAESPLLETFRKLFDLMEKHPGDITYLANLLKKEMLYHLLQSDAGPQFAQTYMLKKSDPGVGKTIQWLKKNFDQSFSVEDLAKHSNMSVSSLHHKFKAFTSMGPLQYQKHLRLQEARRLLLTGESDATEIATRVGYESPSQFSREYRRLFGLPPLKDAKELRKNTQVEELV